MPQLTRPITVIFILMALAQTLAPARSKHAPQTAAQVKVSARIAWEGKPKIARYRLQLARDETFSDIVFDKVVTGREYTITEIPPGRYFWHVAPAMGETGVYSKPLPININEQGTGSSALVSQPTFLTPPNDTGWRTATGAVEQPVAAKLRSVSNFDLIGVNAYGMVYAINGENGVALWSARYRPDAKRGQPTNSDGAPVFTPLLIDSKGGAANVLIAFQDGVRAIEGATGKQLWRAALPGEAMSGVAIKPDNDGASSLVVFDNSKTLTVIKGDSGQVLSQTKLEGLVVGKPAFYDVKNSRGVLLALNNGTLEVRDLAGTSKLAVKLDAGLTTGPLIIRSQRGPLVMIGTESGLVALDASDLTPLWRVATEGDAPQGMLSAADLDADGAEEVLMLTRNGRTVAINVSNGKIKWFADGATDAAQAAFADVNGDGAPDVLVAGGQAFALGFSGKDGTLIWKADEAALRSNASGDAKTPRALNVVPASKDAKPLLVGTDTGRAGLRAVGLPAGALK